MLYAFSPEQEEVRQVLRRLLGEKPSARRVYDDGEAGPDLELWTALVELGVAGLGIAEDDGGSGGNVIDLVVAAEELGRAVAPVPFVGTAVAAEAIKLGAPAEHRASWLAGLAGGALIGAVALDGPRLSSAGSAVSGELPLMYDAAGATLLIASSTDGVVVIPAPHPEARPSVDRTRPVCTVRLEGAPAVPLDGADLGDHLRRLQQTLYAAEATGVAAATLERTAAYTVEREQFGLPIGTFQAVKHRLADMLVDVESARSAAYAAAWAFCDAAAPDAALAVAMAQAVATEVAVRVVGAAVQLHGGIGVTWEHDLHLYLRRAKALELVCGRPGEHLERIATALLGPVRALADR